MHEPVIFGGVPVHCHCAGDYFVILLKGMVLFCRERDVIAFFV